MPKRRTQDVVHAVMTDHLIQRRAPAGDPRAPIAERQDIDGNAYRGEVVPYYPSLEPRTGENALYAAVAQVTQQSNLAQGLPAAGRRNRRAKAGEARILHRTGPGVLKRRQTDQRRGRLRRGCQTQAGFTHDRAQSCRCSHRKRPARARGGAVGARPKDRRRTARCSGTNSASRNPPRITMRRPSPPSRNP